jgi:hypothetical protein
MTNITASPEASLENTTSDPLSELLRSGAKELIAQAVETELQVPLDQHKYGALAFVIFCRSLIIG